MALTTTLPQNAKALEQTIQQQHEMIVALQSKLADCEPADECLPAQDPPDPDCDPEYLKHVYEQATCDREELERCRRTLCSPVVQAKFCAQVPSGEQLWQYLKKIADIEISVACAHEAEAYADWLCCIAQHDVQCRKDLCESVVTTAQCIPKLDSVCISYVQKLTGKCLTW